VSLYVHSWIDRKGLLSIRVKRDNKIIFIKNVWVKKNDRLEVTQVHKNDKTKGII
jgi:hypothetical protein